MPAAAAQLMPSRSPDCMHAHTATLEQSGCCTWPAPLLSCFFFHFPRISLLKSHVGAALLILDDHGLITVI